MLLADEYLISLGFKPGDHVCFSANYAKQCLTISPDYNYRIAGQPIEQIARRETAALAGQCTRV